MSASPPPAGTEASSLDIVRADTVNNRPGKSWAHDQICHKCDHAKIAPQDLQIVQRTSGTWNQFCSHCSDDIPRPSPCPCCKCQALRETNTATQKGRNIPGLNSFSTAKGKSKTISKSLWGTLTGSIRRKAIPSTDTRGSTQAAGTTSAATDDVRLQVVKSRGETDDGKRLPRLRNMLNKHKANTAPVLEGEESSKKAAEQAADAETIDKTKSTRASESQSKREQGLEDSQKAFVDQRDTAAVHNLATVHGSATTQDEPSVEGAVPWMIDAPWWFWSSLENVGKNSFEDDAAQHLSWTNTKKEQWVASPQVKGATDKQRIDIVGRYMVGVSHAALQLSDMIERFVEAGFVTKAHFDKYTDNGLESPQMFVHAAIALYINLFRPTSKELRKLTTDASHPILKRTYKPRATGTLKSDQNHHFPVSLNAKPTTMEDLFKAMKASMKRLHVSAWKLKKLAWEEGYQAPNGHTTVFPTRSLQECFSHLGLDSRASGPAIGLPLLEDAVS